MRTTLLTLLLLVPATAQSRTWNVFEDGSGDAPTVQAGIDSSADGDIVSVGPGTYYETLNLRGKAIELQSSSGPLFTTLNGSLGDNSVITCDSGETNATVISGFTITGGHGYAWTPSSRTGGGIRCANSCPTIEGNIIKGNQAMDEVNSRGGGITFGGIGPGTCSVIIRDNIVEENQAQTNGGGINISWPGIIERNIIRRNRTVRGDGGGAYNLTATNFRVSENLFIENEAGDHGGGLYTGFTGGSSSAIRIENNVFVRNIAHGIEGVSDCSGGAVWLFGVGTITRNTIAFNSGFAAQMDAGGGICLFRSYADVVIEGNILYRNYEGAIRIFEASGTVRHNLMFGNGSSDVVVSQGSPLKVEENLFVDPLFCSQGPESLGELSHQSPALHSVYGVIGAYESGSCGPTTDVRPITWGRLKTLYR